jgi:hypothetical protein
MLRMDRTISVEEKNRKVQSVMKEVTISMNFLKTKREIYKYFFSLR